MRLIPFGNRFAITIASDTPDARGSLASGQPATGQLPPGSYVRRDSPPWERDEAAPRSGEPDHAANSAVDGIALLDTADQALGAIVVRLQAARDLVHRASVKGAAAAQRVELDEALQAELTAADRIAAQTLFKGCPILAGDQGCAYFQTGGQPVRFVRVNLATSVRAERIGAIAIAVSAPLQGIVGTQGPQGVYVTPPITDLNFFTAPRHADLVIDGIPVALRRDWGHDGAGAAAALQHGLNAAAGARYAVRYDDHRFAISASHGPAPTVGAASTCGLWFLGGTTIEAAAPATLRLVPGDFAVQVGADPAAEVTGSFASAAALASAVGMQVVGATARITPDGALQIVADQPIAISGAACARGGLGFSPGIHPTTGSLATVNLVEPAARRDAWLRVYGALQTVMELRSRFAELRRLFVAEHGPQPLAASAATVLGPYSAADATTHTVHAMCRQSDTALVAQGNVSAAAVQRLLQRGAHADVLKLCLRRCPTGAEVCGPT